MKLEVFKSDNLIGEVRIPSSKTHSFRALILASLAKGESVIKKPKLSSDWFEAIKALRMYGAEITEVNRNTYIVKGTSGKLKTPDDVINVGNSGTMLFFILGVASLCEGWSVITGDKSIRKLRTVSQNLIVPFKQLGIEIIATKNDGMAPFLVKGVVRGNIVHLDGTGCQPVFSVLLAAAFSKVKTEILVDNPGETAYIELLLYWFKKVGIRYINVNNNYSRYLFPGNQTAQKFEATMPLEWSAPAYPLLSAVITKKSEIIVKGMDYSDPYGDKLVIAALQKMGADIRLTGNNLIAKSSSIHGVEIDMNLMPDQVPTIAVAGCFAKGKTEIKNAETARWKECDRITAIVKELQKMGAKVIEKKDGLIINQDGTWTLKGANLDGYMDHRMVLSLSVAGLNASGKTIISDAQMVEKSFEYFIHDMKKLGANFKLL